MNGRNTVTVECVQLYWGKGRNRCCISFSLRVRVMTVGICMYDRYYKYSYGGGNCDDVGNTDNVVSGDRAAVGD